RIARTTRYRQISLMGSHNAMRNAQAETRAGYLIFYGRAYVEPLKDPCLFLDGYAGPVVDDLNRQCAIAAKHTDRNGLVCRGVLQSIVNKLLDSKLHQTPIERNIGRLVIADDFEEPTVDLALHRSDTLANGLLHIGNLWVNIDTGGIQASH